MVHNNVVLVRLNALHCLCRPSHVYTELTLKCKVASFGFVAVHKLRLLNVALGQERPAKLHVLILIEDPVPNDIRIDMALKLAF